MNPRAEKPFHCFEKTILALGSSYLCKGAEDDDMGLERRRWSQA